MKRTKSINGYTIYEATSQRDVDTYNCEVGSYNIYLSTDIRDFGLRNSYPEYESIDSLAVALAMCSDSHYGVAVALADELSDSTAQDMDLTLEIERRLESGEALETIRRCYDRETGRLYESISDAIDHGFDPYANDEFDPYEDHPSVGYDEDGRPHIVEDECEWDEDDLDGDLEDVFETAMAEDLNMGSEPDEVDLLCRAMTAAGYDYVPVESYIGWLVFRSDYCDTQHFITWQAVREWLEGVVFDDPEVSDNVERILHPERLDGTRLYDRVHACMTEADYSTPAAFEARLHAIAEELSLTAEDIDGFMSDYLLWYEAKCCEEPDEPEQERRSHASYAVLQDPDDGQYYTIAAPSTEGFDTQARRDDWLLCTVAKHHAFSDCGGYDVIEVVVDGRRVEYVGWQPGMLYEFADCETGEIVWSVSFPEWDH